MLKQEDLYIGRRVAYKELSGILDTYIILNDTEGYSSNMSGTIAHISKNRTREMTKEILNGGLCIYNNSMDADEDVTYDE